jgi:heterodisulfide reductase subunit B
LLPIAVLDLKKKEQKSQHDSIVNCVTQLLAAKQKLAQAKEGRDKDFITNQCNALDTQIDNLVYELYGLTNDEIRIVEVG